MACPDLTPLTSAATVWPARNGSSPRFSGWRPASGVRAMSIAGPAHRLKPLPRNSAATARPYARASGRLKVEASVWADGNEVVPSARTPLGPSEKAIGATPKSATELKSFSARSTFWSKLSAANSSLARCNGRWLASRHGWSAAVALAVDVVHSARTPRTAETLLITAQVSSVGPPPWRGSTRTPAAGNAIDTATQPDRTGRPYRLPARGSGQASSHPYRGMRSATRPPPDFCLPAGPVTPHPRTMGAAPETLRVLRQPSTAPRRAGSRRPPSEHTSRRSRRGVTEPRPSDRAASPRPGAGRRRVRTSTIALGWFLAAARSTRCAAPRHHTR